MPPKGHAVLSASASHRWLNCPPSARLCESYDDKGSDYSAEGTDAHELYEYKLKKALGMEASDPTENLTWYNEEMDDCANGYAAYILELVEAAKETCSDPKVLIEQRVDFSRWVEQGFGTADCIIIADGVLNVVDFKYGLGVEVSAIGNTQMRIYALGALEIFDPLYDIDTVQMTIYQPRKANISVDSISRDDLYDWAEHVLKPAALEADEGNGEFHAGHWCRFCKARHICRERAKKNLELAAYEFAAPPLLSDEEIVEILEKVDSLLRWANDVKGYALQEAVAGKKWDGYKLVEGRSIRKYKNEKAVAEAALAAGYDPYEQRVLGVTEMQKLMGRKKFEEILGAMVTKPQGKPVLVSRDDKRPEMNTINDDFKEEK